MKKLRLKNHRDRSALFVVDVQGGNIIVSLPEERFRAVYYKPAGQPKLILRERSRTDDSLPPEATPLIPNLVAGMPAAPVSQTGVRSLHLNSVCSSPEARRSRDRQTSDAQKDRASVEDNSSRGCHTTLCPLDDFGF
jgi:hypothetical protein